MPSTVNRLSNPDSLRRFPDELGTVQTVVSLNNGGSPTHSWSVSNGSATVISETTKLPSCFTLKIAPSSTAPVLISLPSIWLDGTRILNRSKIRYQFHALFNCANAITVSNSLRSDLASVDPKLSYISASIFEASRSNVLTLDESNDLPSPSYNGNNIIANILVEISEHGGNAIYMTYPSLIDIDEWRFNSFMQRAATRIPTVFADVDEVQEPEYPFFHLLDVLTSTSGDSIDTFVDWFRFEPDELPSDALETDAFVRSRLTDPAIAGKDALRWMGNVIGRPLIYDSYGVDPSTSETIGWMSYSYPLDMTDLLNANLVATDPISITNDLIVVAKWTAVKTSASTNYDISSAVINGATIGGVVVSTGDRVLLKHQLDPTENGIYVVVASGAASRATDADASGEIINGKAVYVTTGTYGGTYWAASVSGSFTLGTDPIDFYEITSPGIIDGVDLSNGMIVLLTAQADSRENGLYTVSSSGTATRTTELSTSANFLDGIHVEVLSGTDYAGTLWRLYAERLIVLNTSNISFVEINRSLAFKRAQIETAMYGHAAGSPASITSAAQRLLTGNRRVSVLANAPSPYYITVRTLFSETPGIDAVDSWTACRVATVDDVNISTDLNNGDVIDGVTLATNDRVLVRQQSFSEQNGIYVVGAVPARATDADNVAEFAVDKVVLVQEGETYGNAYFALQTAPTTMDVSMIIFVEATNLGSSDAILKAIEPTRPLGFKLVHETVNKFAFTFNSPSLGRLGSGALR